MQKLRTGDICPLCGQRITTTDPENLRLLSLLCDSLGLETVSDPYNLPVLFAATNCCDKDKEIERANKLFVEKFADGKTEIIKGEINGN